MLGNNWFECKVIAEKQIDGGMNRNFNETYLVDALDCSSAERRIQKEVGPFCNGSLSITGIRNVKIAELFLSDNDNADKWFKAKVNFVTLDEKSGKEKKTAAYMIIQAFELEEALQRLKQGMRGSMMDYQIAMIQETNLMDVFPFAADALRDDDENVNENINENEEAAENVPENE